MFGNQEESVDNDPVGSPSSSSMAPPSAEFSNVMAQLLMGLEELRRSTEPRRPRPQPGGGGSTTTTATTTPATSTTRNQSPLEVDDVLQVQAELEALVPSLDQLARWTADRADPQSVEADLFRHVQSKTIATAHELLVHVMMPITEPSPLDISEQSQSGDSRRRHHQGSTATGGEPLDASPEAVDDLLRAYQGAVAQTTELVLRLLLQQLPQPSPPPRMPVPATSSTTTHVGGGVLLPTVDEVVQSYVSFQRQTFRTRIKPAIWQLVQERKRGFADATLSPHAPPPPNVQVYNDDGEEDHTMGAVSSTAQTTGTAVVVYEKHHANALAVLLGQAAALIHPLVAWRVNLPPPVPPSHDDNDNINQDDNATGVVTEPLHRMCVTSIHVLNQQAQELCQTVSDWFWMDRPVDALMQQSAAAAGTTPDETRNDENLPDLGFLDGLVDEMALACLLMAQYQTLIRNNHHHESIQPVPHEISSSSSTTTTTTTVISQQLLPEWSWKYAALERFLAVQQWHKAKSVAQPIQIVMGTLIYVPSVVEDAHYLSTRALERAASTQALSAMGTVAHAIAHDVWSTDQDDDTLSSSTPSLGGVHRALLYEQRGCWMTHDTDEPNHDEGTGTTQSKPSESSVSPPPSTNTFASALLDALDQDMGATTASTRKKTTTTSAPSNTTTTTTSRSHPSSGNFLAALTSLSGTGTSSAGSRLMQMHAKFCALNGIHAAAEACRSLVEYLDGLLPESTTTNDAAARTDAPHPGSEDLPSVPPQEDKIVWSAEDEKAIAMIQLTREELFRYANTYDSIQTQKVKELVGEYAKILPDNDENGTDSAGVLISGNGLCLDHIGAFVAHESYQIDAKQLQELERDERLATELMGPLESYIFLQQIASRLEPQVLVRLAEHLVDRVVHVILTALWRLEKRFTDWGSLLLSKQVRMIQTYIERCATPSSHSNSSTSNNMNNNHPAATAVPMASSSSSLMAHWEPLHQVVALLQMEQPAEWLMYHGTPGSAVLTPDQVGQTMALRVDFAPEAIGAVTQQLIKLQQQQQQQQPPPPTT